MAIYIDTLDSDLGWSKTGSWCDSTYSITGGNIAITAGAGGANTSGYIRNQFDGLNATITVTTTGNITGIPQIHLRESSSGNYLKVYIDPSDASLHMGKVSGGVYTEISSISSAITSSGSFTFTAKVYGNCLYSAVRANDGTETIYKQLKYIDSSISAYKGTSHGIGASSGTVHYSFVDMRTLTSFTNVVCVGDSNVGNDNRYYWPNLLMKKHFFEGFVSENQGVGGKATQWFLDNESTTMTPFIITGDGVRNILSIATGNNDFAVYHLSAASCYAKQLQLITDAKAMGYSCELATLIPFVYTGDPLTFVTDLNTLIRAGYVSNGYTLCEIHNAFGATNGAYGVNPSNLVNSDQIHYSTSTGHPMAAQTHTKTLYKNYRIGVQ